MVWLAFLTQAAQKKVGNVDSHSRVTICIYRCIYTSFFKLLTLGILATMVWHHIWRHYIPTSLKKEQHKQVGNQNVWKPIENDNWDQTGRVVEKNACVGIINVPSWIFFWSPALASICCRPLIDLNLWLSLGRWEFSIEFLFLVRFRVFLLASSWQNLAMLRNRLSTEALELSHRRNGLPGRVKENRERKSTHKKIHSTHTRTHTHTHCWHSTMHCVQEVRVQHAMVSVHFRDLICICSVTCIMHEPIF